MQDDNQGTVEELTPQEAGDNHEDNQLSPMPSEDQKQTEDVTTEPVEQGEDDVTLPEEASDRTKRNFEKIREENRRLKDQLEQYGTSVFDNFRPQQTASPQLGQEVIGNLNPQQVDSIRSQFVDEEGNVDINGLNSALRQANDRAQRAEQEARNVRQNFERFEETQQVREAHAVHSWLDPKSPDFDATRFEMVRDRILRVKYYEGKPITLLEAANDVAKSTKAAPDNLEKVKEEAVAQFKKNQSNRNQGPLESGKGEPRTPTVTTQELRDRTRMGDDSALTERMIALGLIKSED